MKLYVSFAVSENIFHIISKLINSQLSTVFDTNNQFWKIKPTALIWFRWLDQHIIFFNENKVYTKTKINFVVYFNHKQDRQWTVGLIESV